MGTTAEKMALRKKSNIWILVGLVLMIGGRFIAVSSPKAGQTGSLQFIFLIVVMVVGLIFWFGGLAFYSQSKGYSQVLALLGLLSIIGLLILVVLPDKYQTLDDQPKPYSGSFEV